MKQTFFCMILGSLLFFSAEEREKFRMRGPAIATVMIGTQYKCDHPVAPTNGTEGVGKKKLLSKGDRAAENLLLLRGETQKDDHHEYLYWTEIQYENTDIIFRLEVVDKSRTKMTEQMIRDLSVSYVPMCDSLVEEWLKVLYSSSQ